MVSSVDQASATGRAGPVHARSGPRRCAGPPCPRPGAVPHRPPAGMRQGQSPRPATPRAGLAIHGAHARSDHVPASGRASPCQVSRDVSNSWSDPPSSFHRAGWLSSMRATWSGGWRTAEGGLKGEVRFDCRPADDLGPPAGPPAATPERSPHRADSSSTEVLPAWASSASNCSRRPLRAVATTAGAPARACGRALRVWTGLHLHWHGRGVGATRR